MPLNIKEGYQLSDIPVLPCGYRMLIRQQVKEDVTAGGIVLGTQKESDRQQKGQTFGEVIALGPECYNKGKIPWCKVGDIVRYRAYTGEIFQDKNNDNGVYWHIMNDEDILGVVPQEYKHD